MPGWFFPVMLVVVLAGYVFLFIQGRMVRGGQQQLSAQLARLESALRELASRPVPAPIVAAAEPAEVHPELEAQPPPSPEEIAAAIEPQIRTVVEAIHEQALTLETLREMVALTEETVKAAGERGARLADLSAEEVARRFLLEEGFSRIHVTGSDAREGGTRFLVRAMRGDEVRTGHVLVRDSKIAEASMKAPSAIFP